MELVTRLAVILLTLLPTATLQLKVTSESTPLPHDGPPNSTQAEGSSNKSTTDKVPLCLELKPRERDRQLCNPSTFSECINKELLSRYPFLKNFDYEAHHFYDNYLGSTYPKVVVCKEFVTSLRQSQEFLGQPMHPRTSLDCNVRKNLLRMAYLDKDPDLKHGLPLSEQKNRRSLCRTYVARQHFREGSNPDWRASNRDLQAARDSSNRGSGAWHALNEARLNSPEVGLSATTVIAVCVFFISAGVKLLRSTAKGEAANAAVHMHMDGYAMDMPDNGQYSCYSNMQIIPSPSPVSHSEQDKPPSYQEVAQQGCDATAVDIDPQELPPSYSQLSVYLRVEQEDLEASRDAAAEPPAESSRSDSSRL